MIDIVLIIIFSYMAFNIVRAVRKEAKIYREFNQSQSISWLSLLFPLGPIVYLTTVNIFGWLPAIIFTIICYLPALFIARKRISFFDCAGTDKVKKAKNAASQTFIAATTGIVYSAFKLTMVYIGNAFA